MQIARKVLTPDALAMLQTIADTGSFAAAARALASASRAFSATCDCCQAKPASPLVKLSTLSPTASARVRRPRREAVSFTHLTLRTILHV